MTAPMAPREHELKCWPEFFGPVSSGEKTFELRRDDRDPPYATGDVLRLREWTPADGAYTGRECRKRVNYMLGAAADFGLAPGHVIMGLAVADDAVPAPPEPGANALDTPEVREAVAQHVRWFNCDRGDWEGAVSAIVAALAPHVAAAQRAAQRAAFRAGVEAAVECCDHYEPDEDEKAWTAAATLGDRIKRLPTPAAFAAAEPDGWRPIETAPTDETRIFLYARGGTIGVGCCYSGPEALAPARYVLDGATRPHPGITHWMPPPSPPEAAP